MPRARRRTLSHNEIENFLSEIENKDGPIKSTSMKNEQYESVEDENVLVEEEVAANEVKDEAQHIRDYCKIIMRQHPHKISMDNIVDLGKSVFEHSNYKLVTSRLMFPDEFLHPPTSMEAKKSLLISLSPMLTEAEEQRKKDTQELEDFTRCKSSKGRGRANYEYIDVDLSARVDFADFERRYMMFIRRNKKPSRKEADMDIPADTLAALNQSVNKDIEEDDTVETGTMTGENECNKENMDDNEDVVNVSDDFAGETSFERKAGDRKRKHASVDRRGTLSPASARAMFLNACEEEQEALAALQRQQQQQESMETNVEVAEEATSSSSNNNNLIMEDDDLLEFDDNVDFSKTSKHQMYSNRRNTLSPSSAKSLAFEIINEEEAAQQQASAVEEVIESEIQEEGCERLAYTTRESPVPMERSETPLVEDTPTVEEEQVVEEVAEIVEEEVLVSEGMAVEHAQSIEAVVVECAVICEETVPFFEVEKEVEAVVEAVPEVIEEGVVVEEPVAVEAAERVAKPADELVSQLDEILQSSDEEEMSADKDDDDEEECDQLGDHSTSQIDQHRDVEPVSVQHHHAVFAPSVPTATPKKCCFSPAHHSAPSSSSGSKSARKHIMEEATEVEESDLILLSETAILKAMQQSPCPKVSAFFGRKSEIADILKVAMNIFEESESELEVFQQLEMMVEKAYAEKQHAALPSADNNDNPPQRIEVAVEDLQAMLIDLKQFEQQATQRLQARMAKAQLQYRWEVVSAHAANAAIAKRQLKQQQAIEVVITPTNSQ